MTDSKLLPKIFCQLFRNKTIGSLILYISIIVIITIITLKLNMVPKVIISYERPEWSPRGAYSTENY